jgi:hypothetical protein
VTGNNIICFNCGGPGHIAPDCPHKKLAHQKHSNVRPKANSANSTGGSNTTETNELVCCARAITMEQAFVARRIIDYNQHPTLPRPRPQPLRDMIELC